MTNKRLAKGRATAAVADMYGEGASVGELDSRFYSYVILHLQK